MNERTAQFCSSQHKRQVPVELITNGQSQVVYVLEHDGFWDCLIYLIETFQTVHHLHFFSRACKMYRFVFMVYEHKYHNSGHYPSSCIYLTYNLSDIRFCLRLQVKPTQLSSTCRSSLPRQRLALSFWPNLVGST
jgi:hypothetical protein